MDELFDALASLFDSLNALSFRLARSDDRGNWIARINFRIGNVQEDLESIADPEGATRSANRFAGRASTADPRDLAAIDHLLGEVEAFLSNA